MKLNAMSTLSFATVLILGAAVVGLGGGCTVTTGTPDDDGGTTSDGSTGTTSDAGDGGGDSSTATCTPLNQTKPFINATCQNCLNAQCCTELKGCFNATTTGGAVGCQEYADCIAQCNTKPQAERKDCFDLCDAASQPSIVTAYDALVTCGVGSGSNAGKCNASCQ